MPVPVLNWRFLEKIKTRFFVLFILRNIYFYLSISEYSKFSDGVINDFVKKILTPFDPLLSIKPSLVEK